MIRNSESEFDLTSQALGFWTHGSIVTETAEKNENVAQCIYRPTYLPLLLAATIKYYYYHHH